MKQERVAVDRVKEIVREKVDINALLR
jgi:hypothetical protein